MKLRQAEPRRDELGYSPWPNPHWPLCVLSHENTRLPLVPQATYVKTEEIAARKGVIFLRLKECTCVCVCVGARTTPQRASVWMCVPACVRSTQRESESARGGKRDRPLIR